MTNPLNSKQDVLCKICGKKYIHRASLFKHKNLQDSSGGTIKWKNVYVHMQIQQFRNYIFTQILVFWRILKCTNSLFKGVVRVFKNFIQYYYCKRSGLFKGRGTGKRCLKTQATLKIRSYCTASITVSKTNDNKFFEVQVYKTL